MRHTGIAVPLALALLTLTACGKAPPSPTQTSLASQTASVPAASVYAKVAVRANGFSIGNMMATRVVYVLFDSQCPHCGRLWQEVKPLLGQIRMVWAPVRFIGELSAQQGATLLASKDPTADMEAHERSLDAKRGGLVPPANVPADFAAKVAANTKLMQEIGVSSVPFVVYKNQATGQPLSFEGAMTTEDLRKTFGL